MVPTQGVMSLWLTSWLMAASTESLLVTALRCASDLTLPARWLCAGGTVYCQHFRDEETKVWRRGKELM